MSKNRVFFLAAIFLFALLPFNSSAADNLPAKSIQSVTYAQLDLGSDISCAITSSGASVCWGVNDEYYLQLGTTTPEEFFPFPIRPMELEDTALKISSGDYHSCVINSLDQTWCWGDDYYGQLGDGLEDSDGFPVQVVTFTDPLLISAGGNTTCGVDTAGQAYCWGLGSSGQMGNGTSIDNNYLPVPVIIVPVSKISAGGAYQVCAISFAGAAYCWGADTWGQLGDDALLANKNLPVQVSGLFNGTMADIAAGGVFTCGLTIGGGVKCWGYNGDGALGNNSTANSPVPVDVSGLASGVSAIATGDYHACALMAADGAVKCWGYNGYGQLGDGTYDNRLVPVPVVGLGAPAIAISAGGNHTCAILNDGRMQCWGDNSEGQLGIGDDDPYFFLNPVTAINEIGSAMGTVTYSGTQPSWHKIYVTLHENLVDPPFDSYWIYQDSLYAFGGLEDGSFYIGAFMDVDDDGGGPPDPWEPGGWYDGNEDGEPDLVTISSGANLYELNIELFDPVKYTLTVAADPADSGTITKSPDQATYQYGDVVILTPASNPGWTFSNWSGATVTDNQVTITGDTTVTANFTQNEYTLSVAVDPYDSGTVSVNPVKATYQYGDVVTLTPAANPGWTFSNWSGATVIDNKVTITDDTTITANFEPIEYTLTVTADPTDSGTITKSPDHATYHYGEVVTLTPAANPGWTFSGWTGASVTDNKVTITGNTTVTGNFTQNEYSLTVTVNPEGKGTVEIDPVQTTHHYGDKVTLTAAAESGWIFSEWSGDVTGTANPLLYTIVGNTTIVAWFDQTSLDLYLPLILR